MARHFSLGTTELLQKLQSPYAKRLTQRSETPNLPSTRLSFSHTKAQSTDQSQAEEQPSTCDPGSPGRSRVLPPPTDTGGYVERIRPHVKSPIPLHKQTRRDQYRTPTYDVSAGRFVSFNDFPEISSKTRRISTPDMKKGLKRSSPKVGESSPEYDANYKVVWQKTAKPGVRFDKRTGRQFYIYKHINDLSYEPVNFEYVRPKMKVPDIEKQFSRPDHNILPSFMVKVQDRFAINMITDKGLDMNNYAESDFPRLISTLKGAERYYKAPVKSKGPRKHYRALSYNVK